MYCNTFPCVIVSTFHRQRIITHGIERYLLGPARSRRRPGPRGVSIFGPRNGGRRIRYGPERVFAPFQQNDRLTGNLEVFIELRDINYPGSTYTLTYDRQNDILHGTYFQATMQQTYDIAFTRQESNP